MESSWTITMKQSWPPIIGRDSFIIINIFDQMYSLTEYRPRHSSPVLPWLLKWVANRDPDLSTQFPGHWRSRLLGLVIWIGYMVYPRRGRREEEKQRIQLMPPLKIEEERCTIWRCKRTWEVGEAVSKNTEFLICNVLT